MPEKQVIYYDEYAKDRQAEERRYSASKLHNAAIKEQERFDHETLFEKTVHAILDLLRQKTK
ncbi:MAG: hypothetical protein IKV10_04030 [Alphaproteobacteria bacterium]|nr:hypothetical protein [Alphaproteobacteria bacterium]